MKLTLDFSASFNGPDGNSVQPPMTQAALLSNLLSQTNKGDPVKMWGWACALAKASKLEDLDCADVDTLEKFIREYPGGTNALSVAQLLETITNAKLEYLKKPE